MTERQADTTPQRPVMRAEAVSMHYPGTTALNRVDFDVMPGQVNVLIGENGAGKSTLMRIIAGIEQPTEGRLYLDGEPVELGSPREAMDRGIGIVHQELNLFPNLSIAENIFVGKELSEGLGRVRQGEQRRLAAEVLERMRHPLDVDVLVQDLSIGAQQIVEIAKVLVADIRVLILDEPTSSLSQSEVEVLFAIIRELRAQGVAIVYISHRLEELLEIGDTFTVLRDGRLVGRATADDVSMGWIVERMVGQQVEAGFSKSAHSPGETVMTVDHLSVPHPTGGLLLDDVSFSVRAGEVVGLYGLMGAGRTELFETLIGLRRSVAGRIEIDGRAIPPGASVADRIARGLALVPEDRQRLGLVQSQSVADNLLLTHLRAYWRYAWLDPRPMRRDVARIVKELGIKVADASAAITALSGGNQQKAVLGKNLLTRPRLLLLDEPTRGIDVKAKREVFQLIDRLSSEGFAIVFASSELAEVMGGADRVIVMTQGRVTAEFTRDELSEERLVQASQFKRNETKEAI